LLTNIPGAERVAVCEDEVFTVPSPPLDVWVEAAENPAYTGDASATPVDPVSFLPKLEVFSASGLTGPQVIFFVTRRRQMGVPLKEVWLDDDTVLEQDEEEWLKANLDHFSYFEDSDVEDDDDEEELFIDVLDDDGFHTDSDEESDEEM
jgi:hypothetical protein